MSQFETAFKSYTAGAALGVFVRVKKSGDNVVLAGATEAGIGVTQNPASSGGLVNVRLFNGEGSFTITAAGAFSANAPLYAAANGQVDDSGTVPIGTAEEASTGAGDQVEVLASSEASLLVAATAAQTAAEAAAANTLSTTVAIANTGTPDGVAHVTGQVEDGNGDPLAGRFLITVYFCATAYGDPTDLGTATAKTNSRVLKVDTTDALLRVLTHSDGSWGVDLDTAIDGTVHVHAAINGTFATANAAITGN